MPEPEEAQTPRMSSMSSRLSPSAAVKLAFTLLGRRLLPSNGPFTFTWGIFWICSST